MKTHTGLVLALLVATAGCNSKRAEAPASHDSLAAAPPAAEMVMAKPSSPSPMKGGGGEGGSGDGAGVAVGGAAFGGDPGALSASADSESRGADAPKRRMKKEMAADSMLALGEAPSEEVAEPEPMRYRPMAGQLTAGEWNDVDNWDFWTSLMGDGYGAHLQTWRFGLDQRMSVKVTGGNGALRNVPVKLIDNQGNAIWTTKTDGQGEAVVFAGLQAVSPFKLQVGDEAPRAVKPGESVDMRLNAGPKVADAIDVMFVVDTTGSMADELAYIQSEITDVANRVKQRTNNEFALRVAASVYRDNGDEYVVKSSRFSTDVRQAKSFLDKESAGGGGDFPEAVDEALDEAISEHQWAPNARARILFLVLDAPPHQDAEGLARLQKAIKSAAAQGIQLVPVVGSGIDKPTEFLMRGMAIATNGTYVFLTDDSGIGGGHIKPTTGDYTVEKLNDLLVRLIVERAS